MIQKAEYRIQNIEFRRQVWSVMVSAALDCGRGLNVVRFEKENVERPTSNVERSQEPHPYRDVKPAVKKLQSFPSTLGVQRSMLGVRIVKTAAARQPCSFVLLDPQAS